MRDRVEKEWMESVCDGKKFALTYDTIADLNPNPGYNIE